MSPETLDAIRGHLPATLWWGSKVAFPIIVFLTTVVSTRLAASFLERRWRRSVERREHWSQSNIASYIAMSVTRRFAIFAMALPIALGFVLGSPFEAAWSGFAAIVAGLIAVYGQRFRLLGTQGSLWQFVSVTVRANVAFGFHLLVFLVLIPLVPFSFADPILWVAVAAQSAACWVAVVHSKTVAIWLGILEPAGEKLADAVAEAGDVAPDFYLLKSYTANAYAATSANAIFFTTTAYEALDSDELKAVALHELAHMREPAASRRIRAARVGLVALLLLIPAAISEAGLWGLGGSVVMLLAIVLWIRRFDRRAEEDADRGAHEGDPETFARALETVYRLNRMSVVTPNGGSIHPDLYDRMEAAGVSPDYPRPTMSRFAGMATLVAGSVGITVVLVAAILVINSGAFLTNEKSHYQWRTARSPTAGELSTLAELAAVEGRATEAFAYISGAVELDSDIYYVDAYVEYAWRAGRCDALMRADRLVDRADDAPPFVDQTRERLNRYVLRCGP